MVSSYKSENSSSNSWIFTFTQILGLSIHLARLSSRTKGQEALKTLSAHAVLPRSPQEIHMFHPHLPGRKTHLNGEMCRTPPQKIARVFSNHWHHLILYNIIIYYTSKNSFEAISADPKATSHPTLLLNASHEEAFWVPLMWPKAESRTAAAFRQAQPATSSSLQLLLTKEKKRKSDQHNVPTSNMFCNLIADGKFLRWFSLLVRDDLAAGLDDTSMILAVAGRFCRTSSFSCPTTVQTWQVSKCTKNFPKTTSTISISIILGQTFLVASMFCDDWMLRVSPDCWGCKWSIPRSLLDLTQSYPRHLRDSGVPAWKPSSSISWTYYCTYCVDQAKWIPITDNPN